MPISAFLWRTGRRSPTFTLFFKTWYFINSSRQRPCLLWVFFTSNYNVSVIKKNSSPHIMCTSKGNTSFWFPSKFCFRISKMSTFSDQWQIDFYLGYCLFRWILFFKLWRIHKIHNCNVTFLPPHFCPPFSTVRNSGLSIGYFSIREMPVSTSPQVKTVRADAFTLS